MSARVAPAEATESAAFERIAVEPLTPVIGAEVSGVDLAAPLDDATFAEIHAALLRHQVIFFREQEIDLDQQKAFGRRFGTLHVHPAAPKLDGHPEILVVHADENSRHVAGHGWHSDVSCDERPPMGSILRLTQVPEGGGGDTMFASMYAAYEALSDRMKGYLDGLQAVHSSEHVYRGRYGVKQDLRDERFPESVHPVVRTHPETGRKALFVNAGFTTRLKGVPKAESDAMLDVLFKHIATPEFHCRFRWRANSIAFWDNRCAQHHALWDYYPQVRHGYRVTIEGDKPV